MSKGKVGEIYLCNADSNGEPVLLRNFKGVKITNICGGYYRAFILEEGDDGQGKIHSLHPPEYDEYDYTFTEKNIEDLAQTQKEVQDDIRSRYTHRNTHSDQEYEYQIEDQMYGSNPSQQYGRELSAVKEDEAEYPDMHYKQGEEDRGRGQSQDAWEENGEDQGVGLEEMNGEGHEIEEDREEVMRFSDVQNAESTLERKDSLQTDNAIKIHTAFDNKGSIKEIVSGKSHILLLNEAGGVYSYGYGEYGSLGRGKPVYSPHPQKINTLNPQCVKKVCCGYQHCLALNKVGDVYSWGRGFEGQLGLQLFPDGYKEVVDAKPSKSHKYRQELFMKQAVQLECASFPRVLRLFTKNRQDKEITKERRKWHSTDPNTAKYECPDYTIEDIACGAYHSLAITKTGKLYGWGDSGCGQLGIGRKPKVWIPTQIKIKEKVTQAAAGYAHSVCITTEGFVYTFGLNHKFQLGFDDQKSRYEPCRLEDDDNGIEMQPVIKVGSGDYNSFGLTAGGQVYAWGSGILGFKEVSVLNRPTIIKNVLGDRKITDMYVNSGNVILFSPFKIISMKPNSGPSTGGTIFSLLGVGLCDMNGTQRIKFNIENYKHPDIIVDLNYNESTNSFYSQTPNFDGINSVNPIQWPCRATVSVTLDGVTWFPSDTYFFIYSSKTRISNIIPKFASVEGGLEGCIELLTDQKTMKEFTTVSVGLQATNQNAKQESQKLKDKELDSDNQEEKGEEMKSLNPIDLPLNSPELTKPNWIYFEGKVRDKDIIFTVPPISKLQSTSLYYNVDISLNGQQFLGSPVYFKYYKVEIDRISPDNTIKQGGTKITAYGRGLIDSNQKKVKLSNSKTERLIDVKWDKDAEVYYFFTPPVTWLSGQEDELTDEQEQEIMSEEVKIELTISGKDWISLGHYIYYEPNLTQLLPGPTPDKTTSEETIKQNWPKEEPLTNPLEGLSDKEADKKRIELEKKHKEDLFEIEHIFRKPHSLLYIEGEKFIKREKIIARFVYKNLHWDVHAVYKNEKKIGVEVPVIDGPPEGVHILTVHLSFNGGQEFGHKGLPLKYFCFNKDTPDVERNKLMDAELKQAKKGGAKK